MKRGVKVFYTATLFCALLVGSIPSFSQTYSTTHIVYNIVNEAKTLPKYNRNMSEDQMLSVTRGCSHLFNDNYQWAASRNGASYNQSQWQSDMSAMLVEVFWLDLDYLSRWTSDGRPESYSEMERCFARKRLELRGGSSSPRTPPPSIAAPAPTTKPAPSAADIQRYQREKGVFVAIQQVDGELKVNPNLSAQQKSLQNIWSIRQLSATISRMPESTVSPQMAENKAKLGQFESARVRGCSSVTNAAERNACVQGAFFGSAEQFTTIAKAGADKTQTPTLKRRGVDNVNRCLTVDFKGLFGGFINNCDFSVMYVYCVENPDKGAWSEAFRCLNGPRGIKALGVVGPHKADGAHTHRGRVIFFACAWQGKTGPGPDGIWGETAYSEGVGTPGIIRGTCGEQYYSP